ncbi:MetQ/NlpA family ABC transporter substrate-binding protein [Haloimpatiens lingqiaonensis]|uniref:MetQ/NlpA family ABC transporter substrate-binding protein n=1 Tax=Haloimpatiens lingqiaonensis TaxID=1380675 RepID=UPI0010FECF6B|nr:MetQ/NlpA family ABC transporter substrate-binding protein [Haloimpatiens lingqiaonensis]
MKKKICALLGVLFLSTAIIGCGGKTEGVKSSSADGKDKKEIIVGASPVPHREILEKAGELIKKQGYTLKIVEFTDYQTPNIALAEGQLDANFFQHVPFLNKTVEEKKLDLDYTVKVHIEPMGVYSNKLKDIKEIKDGAEIAVPNDPTNGSRALKVLQSAGLIKVKDGEVISKLDITENKKNLKITEVDAPQLPRILSDVDAAVINTNFAIEAKLNPTKDALLLEDKDSPYANIIAVKKEDKNKEYIKVLSKVLTSPEIKKFIEEKYNGSIVPAF